MVQRGLGWAKKCVDPVKGLSLNLARQVTASQTTIGENYEYTRSSYQFGRGGPSRCFAPAPPLDESFTGTARLPLSGLSRNRQGLRRYGAGRARVESRRGDELYQDAKADVSAVRGLGQKAAGREAR